MLDARGSFRDATQNETATGDGRYERTFSNGFQSKMDGAPANFAWHDHAPGAEAPVVSRVGPDELGDEILAQFDSLGLPADCVSVDRAHATGTVSVEVAGDGQPQFTIRMSARAKARHRRCRSSCASPSRRGEFIQQSSLPPLRERLAIRTQLGLNRLPMSRTPSFTVAAMAALVSLQGSVFAGDWPQWRGPDRTDVSKETGLLKQWPEGGPKKVWSYTNAGNGYAGMSVADGRLFTMGARAGQEFLIALDAASGKELWAAAMGPLYNEDRPSYNVGWGEGPRGTPTVDADRVYALGAWGNLVCASVKDGKIVWKKTMQEVGGKPFGWGYSESPLVDGPKLVCTPGGSQGAIAALDKMTGAPVWQSKDFTDDAQYSSLVPATINGTPQYVQLTMRSVAGVAAKDGKLVWRVDFPGRVAVIPTPIVRDNRVFVTAGYGVGCKLVEIGPDNSVNEVYRNTNLANHHGGAILVGDHVYGHSDRSGWTCLDFQTGEVAWQEKGKLGKGAIACADGMFYLLDEKSGEVVLIEVNPGAWSEKGRFKLDPQSTIRNPKGGIWSHPVISNGKLYLRDQDLIHCYDIKS